MGCPRFEEPLTNPTDLEGRLMNESIFLKLIAQISSKLRIMEELGTPITTDVIANGIEELASGYRRIPNFEMSEEDVGRLKFHIGSIFNVRVGEHAISLHNPDLPRWFDSKKHEIDWRHWTAYKSMLESQGRARDIIDANERVIDDILDYSGDPTTPGTWARKGLVMGNVQSGKTQNYIGLINKAIDCGYKTIILLGGHLNDLRKQTQERVDEGVLGRESRHLAGAQATAPTPIGVGIFQVNSINTGTTTVGDFNKAFADRLGFSLAGEDPVIFTVKKNTGVMERLCKWISDYHYLDPEIGNRLDGPLLLIDDEADYASINTKHHKEEVTKTNDFIRNLLSLFHRNTYVGYTATPFANIFIDPDSNSYSDKDDLFPSDFMIKMPVPDNYLGQDFFFGQESDEGIQGGHDTGHEKSPAIPITDHWPLYELKKTQEISSIPDSLEEAVRAFVLVIAIRSLRGDRHAHNTMLVNISHLTIHQNKLEDLIGVYHKEIDEALDSYSGLGFKDAGRSDILRKIEETFHAVFSVEEEYPKIFEKLREASGRIKVWAINQRTAGNGGKELDYSIHKEHGLCAIVIGGHRLSRGLTLEGLSISYFARNSKAYDTLMQMCRWFGYRPQYADLCRVYLPADSIDWYAFIASAIKDLYRELDLMSRRNQRPKDFGLKVREHPGAMIITAKNKIGWSDTEVRSQDLWGQVQRRFRFSPDPDINRRNLAYVKQFLEGLRSERDGTEEVTLDKETGLLILSGVDYSKLIDFIENLILPEDDLGNAALISHLKKMETAGLGKPKVVLFNQKKSTTTKLERVLGDADRKFINDPYELVDGVITTLAKRSMKHDEENEVYKVKSVHLGNSDDEKLFLSPAARQSVVSESDPDRNPVSFDYICSNERDYPGLLIYLFAVSITPERTSDDTSAATVKLGHGHEPTVGYTVSIPRSENLKGMSSKEIREIVKQTKHSYQVGKVYARLQELSAYEDYEDDE